MSRYIGARAFPPPIAIQPVGDRNGQAGERNRRLDAELERPRGNRVERVQLRNRRELLIVAHLLVLELFELGDVGKVERAHRFTTQRFDNLVLIRTLTTQLLDIKLNVVLNVQLDLFTLTVFIQRLVPRLNKASKETQNLFGNIFNVDLFCFFFLAEKCFFFGSKIF